MRIGGSYFKAREHMDLWKIIFFHSFYYEKNAKPYTIEELERHAKTRKIKLTFTEPTFEQQDNVPIDTILIYIPGCKLSTKNSRGEDVVSKFFSGAYHMNETFAEYILEQWRADVYVPSNEADPETNFSPSPCKPGRQYPYQRYTHGRGGSKLYFDDTKEFRKNPTEAAENSPCDTLDLHLVGISRTTSKATRFYQQIVLHNCKKHPALATAAAVCLIAVVGCVLTRNTKIASLLSSSVGKSV